MRINKIVVSLGLILIANFSVADAGSEKEAEKLMNVMGMDVALEQSLEQMLIVQLQQNPSLAPYKKVMMDFFKKHMNYESLKPDMIKLYSEAFTELELREINEFYQTSTGKKTLEKMPELMARGGEIGAKRVQDNIHELREMIQAESERIQALQAE